MQRGITLMIVACAGLLTGGLSASAASVRPLSIGQFFVEPHEPVVLQWTDAADGDEISFRIRDYAGREVRSGRVQADGGRIAVPVNLPRGFFEVEFPSTEQRFGVVALPAFSGTPDTFFAIDTAMSWLVRDEATRDELIMVLARSGIGMARERLRWGAIQRDHADWRWDQDGRYETLRVKFHRQGVAVLEMFHDAPRFLGWVGKYPEDLSATAAAWRTIGRRWRHVWGGLEVWNEPDIFFGDHLPADQYVAVVRSLAYAMRDEPELPLVGGAVAHFDRSFLDAAARNELLSLCDAFSFHTYARAEEMERIAGQFRDFLARYDAAGMPVWLTECGRPWRRGPGRPPQDEDAVSAVDIVMKGVESRACGIERYFAFVYPYYDENDWNFGMMDRAATPLRSMAAYAQAVRCLADAAYVGDLSIGHPAVRRARVFRRGDETVAVLYAGAPDQLVTVPLAAPVRRVEGIDGRELPLPGVDGVAIPDGLVYVWLDPNVVLTDATEAMRQSRLAAVPRAPRSVPASLVLRLMTDTTPVRPLTAGYRLTGDTPEQVTLRLSACQLSDEDGEWLMRVAFSDGVDRAVRGAEQRLRLAGGATAESDWELDLRQAFMPDGRLGVTFTASPLGGSGPDTRLSVDLLGEASLPELLAHHPGHRRLPIEEAHRWHPLAAAHAAITLSDAGSAAWQMEVAFGEGDKWAYPQFVLPDDVAMEQFVGLLIRARCSAPAAVRVFLWEGDTNVGYISPGSIIEPDGRWHTAVVRFDELTPSAANAPDPNQRLDLDLVRRISVGFNSEAAENDLELSDVYLFRP